MFVKSLEGGVKSEVGMKTPEVGENIEKNVPTSGEFKNSDVDNYEKQDESYEQKLNGNQFVDRVLYSNFEDVALSSEDKRQLDILLPKIRENLNNYTELDPKNELYQKYQKMISDGEYEDVNELCNGEGLNEDDVYDNEPKIYCEEYSSGLTDGYDDKDFYVDGDYTEAYVKGYNDGKESSSLIKNPGNQADAAETNAPVESKQIMLPEKNGSWDGEKGNSTWTPDPDYIPAEKSKSPETNPYSNPDKITLKDILTKYGVDGINFKEGYPVFDDVSKGTVEVEGFETGGAAAKQKNFAKADLAMSEKKGCSPQEVKHWRMENNYTWHECEDKATMQKVPNEVHANVPHAGGRSQTQEVE